MSDIAFNNKGVKIARVQLSTNSTNPTFIFSGKAIVHHILILSTFASALFIKVYDKASVPDSSDIPIITARFNTGTNAAFPQITAGTRRTLDYFCENGIGIRSTANVEDNDNTNITIPFGIKWIWIVYSEV